MLAHSPRNRSRSPHDTSSQVESISNSKTKKESESQQRMRNLKSFIQTLINESTSIDSTYDEQLKAFESACIEEYRDLSVDRIRRMIRSMLKSRKSHQSPSIQSQTTTPFLHQDHKISTTNDGVNSNENSSKKSRSNNLKTKTSDLVTSPTSTLSLFDADFLRHAFSQQFQPSLDLSSYFSSTTASNGTNTASPSLFRPDFPSSNFLQSLTNTTSLVPPLISSHTHMNGTSDSSTTKSSKQVKLTTTETNSITVLVNAYREAASYLCRSADELEQLI